MAKKNPVFLFFIWLSFFILLFFAGFFIYQKELIPQFNFWLNSFFYKESTSIAVSLPEIEPIRIASGEIGEMEAFAYKIRDSQFLIDIEAFFREDFFDNTDSFSMSYSEEQKTMKLTGMFQRLDADFDPKDESIRSWTSLQAAPLSAPSLFQDSLVFIDTDLNLIVLDLKTGALKQSFPTPVYPAGLALAVQAPLSLSGVYKSDDLVPQYIIKAADGNVYAFAFFDPLLYEDVKTKISLISDEKNKHPFWPSKEVEKSMMEATATWAQYAVVPDFLEPKLLPSDGSLLRVNAEGISVFALMFKEEGQYQMGMSDASSLFISADALACFFSQTGELLSVSVDYESHKPQVQVLLEADTLYYIVLANKGELPLNDVYFSYKKIK